jgi:hypothetical protein
VQLLEKGLSITITSLIVFLILPSHAVGQDDRSKQKSYSHHFIAEVISIDTVQLSSDTLFTTPETDRPAVMVCFKIKKKFTGRFSGISKFLLMQTFYSDHVCLYGFMPGKTYEIYARAITYTSPLIKRKFRKMFFKLDCHNLPTPK